MSYWRSEHGEKIYICEYIPKGELFSNIIDFYCFPAVLKQKLIFLSVRNSWQFIKVSEKNFDTGRIKVIWENQKDTTLKTMKI